MKVKIANWFNEVKTVNHGGNAEIDCDRIIRAQICNGDTLCVTLSHPLSKGSTTYWIRFSEQTEQIINAIKDRIQIVTS